LLLCQVIFSFVVTISFNYTKFLTMMTENEKQEYERLKRQYERLKDNFDNMVEGDEEADLMLDWMNEIRKRMTALEKK
jgi:hypothetical protein